MDRRQFIGLLGLIGCEDMLIAQHGYLGGALAKKDVFLAIGDSNSAGKGRTLGPVTSRDTLYQYQSGTLVEITTTDISTNTPLGDYGTSYKQFAIDYRANTGHSVVMVTHGKSGANFYPSGDDDNFYTTGDLYAPAVADAAAACALAGVSQVTAVFVNLGINDVRDGVSDANITTGIDSLFDRLETDFPGVPILVIQVGVQDGPVFNSAKLYHIREQIRNAVVTRTDFYFVSNNCSFYNRGATNTYYDVETLHLDQAGNNIQGAQMARWFTLSSYSKPARNVLSCMMVLPSTTRMNLIATFVDNQVAASNNFYKMDMLYLYKTNDLANIFLDWTFFWVQTDVVSNVTFNTNSDIETNGSTSFIANYNPNYINTSLPTQTDWIYGVKQKQNLTPNPSSLIMFGGRESAILATTALVQISGGPGNFTINSVTSDNNGVTRYADDTLFCIARTGTTARYIENSTTITSVTRASTGKTNNTITIGALNTGLVQSFFYAGKFEYCFSARYSDFDISSFYTDMETLLDNW